MSSVGSSWLAGLLAFFSVSLLAAPALGQGQLWIVDGFGGGDYLELQPAIDAASDGDTILLRKFNQVYSGAVVDGKSLVIVGGIWTAPYGWRGAELEDLTVRNLASDQQVTLRNFWATEWIELESNTGPVWLDYAHAGDRYSFPFGPTQSAITIRDCLSVMLTRCQAFGPRSAPGNALTSIRSDVYSYYCELQGRTGADYFSSDPVDGPAGVQIVSGRLFDSGSTIVGGVGVDYEEDCSGAVVGDGGPGLLLGLDSPDVHLLGTVLQGGEGGECGYWVSGDDGPPFDVRSGTLTFLPEPPRLLWVDSPMMSGSNRTFHYMGEPGDYVIWASAAGPYATRLLRFRGALLLDASMQFQPWGFVTAWGGLDISLPITQPAPGTAYSVYAQVGALDTSFKLRLSSGTVLTVMTVGP
jgi:hypothetical protein